MTSVAYGLAFPATRGVLTYHAAGGGFDPTTLFYGDSGGWWDPSDMSTLYQDSAGTTPVTAADQPIGRINDKSGNGNNLVQATSAKRPTLRNGGALWWLEFDGADDVLKAAAFTLDQPLTRISAAQQVSWTTGDRLWEGGGVNQCNAQQVVSSPTIQIYGGKTVNYNLFPVGEDHVLTEIFNGASSHIATDNGSYTDTDLGSDAAGGVAIGANANGAQNCDLHWFGAIWIGRLLSTPEIAQARSFLGAKAGLSL